MPCRSGLRLWQQRLLTSHQIVPGENGYVESFNARLRDELLDGKIVYTLREAQIVFGGRNDFGLNDAPIGACILYALSCNLSDSELADHFDIFSRSGGTLFDDLEESEDSEGEEDIETPDEDSNSGGKGNKVRLKDWSQRRGKTLGYEVPGGRPVPLIDQAHRLMQLWRAGEEAKVDDYLDTRGLKRNTLFAQLLQALIELAPAASEERSILESLSNHIASRGGISAPRQIGMEV
jgi:putative DNA methylase